MARKLFIVAKGNWATYSSLTKSIGHEPNVEIIYDRRATPRRPGVLGRLVPCCRRVRSRKRRPWHEERRDRTSVDVEIQRTGWAVVRLE
jgi:hypothetical protein